MLKLLNKEKGLCKNCPVNSYLLVLGKTCAKKRDGTELEGGRGRVGGIDGGAGEGGAELLEEQNKHFMTILLSKRKSSCTG